MQFGAEQKRPEKQEITGECNDYYEASGGTNPMCGVRLTREKVLEGCEYGY
jgi:hypothetical protein